MEKMEIVPGQPGYQGPWDKKSPSLDYAKTLSDQDARLAGSIRISSLEELKEAVERLGEYINTRTDPAQKAEALHKLSLIRIRIEEITRSNQN